MALVICPECEKEISDKSDVCINCGFPISKHKNKDAIHRTTCQNCNMQNDAMAYYCISCGYKLKDNDKTNHISNDIVVKKKFPVLTTLSFVSIVLFFIMLSLFQLGLLMNSVLLVSSFVFSVLALKSDEKMALLASIPLIISVITTLMFILIEMIR